MRRWELGEEDRALEEEPLEKLKHRLIRHVLNSLVSDHFDVLLKGCRYDSIRHNCEYFLEKMYIQSIERAQSKEELEKILRDLFEQREHMITSQIPVDIRDGLEKFFAELEEKIGKLTEEILGENLVEKIREEVKLPTLEVKLKASDSCRGRAVVMVFNESGASVAREEISVPGELSKKLKPGKYSVVVSPGRGLDCEKKEKVVELREDEIVEFEIIPATDRVEAGRRTESGKAEIVVLLERIEDSLKTKKGERLLKREWFQEGILELPIQADPLSKRNLAHVLYDILQELGDLSVIEKGGDIEKLLLSSFQDTVGFYLLENLRKTNVNDFVDRAERSGDKSYYIATYRLASFEADLSLFITASKSFRTLDDLEESLRNLRRSNYGIIDYNPLTGYSNVFKEAKPRTSRWRGSLGIDVRAVEEFRLEHRLWKHFLSSGYLVSSPPPLRTSSGEMILVNLAVIPENAMERADDIWAILVASTPYSINSLKMKIETIEREKVFSRIAVAYPERLEKEIEEVSRNNKIGLIKMGDVVEFERSARKLEKVDEIRRTRSVILRLLDAERVLKID